MLARYQGYWVFNSLPPECRPERRLSILEKLVKKFILKHRMEGNGILCKELSFLRTYLVAGSLWMISLFIYSFFRVVIIMASAIYYCFCYYIIVIALLFSYCLLLITLVIFISVIIIHPFSLCGLFSIHQY